MRTRWLSTSRRDLVRLHAFLKDFSPATAGRIVRMLNNAVKTLPDFPHKGPRVEDYAPREVKSLFVGDYEVRYEVLKDEIVVLNIWHTREDR